MVFSPNIRHRRSIHLKGYDYSQHGAYFVTICVSPRHNLFGDIENGEMRLNEFGRVVESVWRGLPEHFTGTDLDEFVIMPDHFHGILNIFESPVGAKQGSSASPAFDLRGKQGEAGETFASPLPHGTISGSCAAIIQNFKSISTRKINKIRENPGCPVWQRDYYERIIRNETELGKAREYIVNNPLKWKPDKEYPANIA